jgi:hypothetical protein
VRPCRLLLDLTRRGVAIGRRPAGGVTVRPASRLAEAERAAVRVHARALGGLVARRDALDADGAGEALRAAYAGLDDADVQRLDDEAEHDDFAAVLRLLCTGREVAA